MITVTNTNDSGAGSLRQAIADATTGEEITFSVTGTITLSSGNFFIDKDLIITGPGSGLLTIDPEFSSGIFHIDTGVVSISGLTLTRGGGVGNGGGIDNIGTLTISDIVVQDCSADVGAGIYNESTINATNCSVINCNTTDGEGGGIKNIGTFNATNLEIQTCTAVTAGGGIWSDGTFTHNGGEITGCTTGSSHGGGVYNEGTYTATEVFIRSNDANLAGDGIYVTLGTVNLIRCEVSLQPIDGLFCDAATINIDNSTISTNTVFGIINALGSVVVQRSTITGSGTGITMDSGSFVSFQNTILCGNTTDYEGDSLDVVSDGNNIFGVESNPITPGPDDQQGVLIAAVALGPLQDNGGPTHTHALLTGSVAIDAGNSAGAPATDQRGSGYSRVINGTMDIGAFEAEGDVPPEPPTECSPAALIAAATCLPCLPADQIRVAKIMAYVNILLAADEGADVTPETLVARGACFACLSPDQRRTIRLQLLCSILAGEGGGAGIVCECVTPTLTSFQQTSESAPFTASLTWTLPETGCETPLLAIYRSINGGDFEVWAENIPATDLVYENNGNNPVGSANDEVTIKLKFYAVGESLDCDFSNELSITITPA